MTDFSEAEILALEACFPNWQASESSETLPKRELLLLGLVKGSCACAAGGWARQRARWRAVSQSVREHAERD